VNSAGLSSALVGSLMKFDLNSWELKALDFDVCSCNLFCLSRARFPLYIYICIYILHKN
jgi:hypothetical protein